LDKTGSQTAIYFKKISDKVNSTQDPVELKQLLGGVAKIGAMAQYGDLTPSQDQILTKLLKEGYELSKG
jgi:hypothetical protein